MSLSDRKNLPHGGGLPPPEPGFEWVFDPNTFEPWQKKIDDPALSSVAIQRIIDEVKNDKDAPLSGYNRVYHRHNR